MTRRFHAPRWAWLGLLSGCALFAGLGVWQIERGEQKQLLLDQYSRASAASPVQLHAGSGLPHTRPFLRVRATGYYLGKKQILLDGQWHADNPGYNVWTPLRMGDGSVILVNRGWVPVAPNRHQLANPPFPDQQLTVTGLWRHLPRAAIRVGSNDDCSKTDSPWPRLLVYPTLNGLRCLYGQHLLPGELLLDPKVDGGFVRQWAMPVGMSPMRHYSYAVQWFAFLLVLLILFIAINLRKRE